MNSCNFAGILLDSPNVQSVGDKGTSLVRVRLSVQSGAKKDGDGTWKNEYTSLRLEVWDKLADDFAKRLKKGDAIYVQSEVKEKVYEKDGVEKRDMSFKVMKFGWLPKKLAPKKEEAVEASEEIPF